jgi:hypothetical protein
MEQARLSRRGLMRAAAGTAAGAGMAGALAPGAASAHPGEGARRRRDPEDLVPRQNIGIQLYTLRDMAQADLPAALTMLADIGYPEVELFQLHGRSAPELRALLDERRLRALAAHVGIARWRTELETVLDEAQALGMTFVGLPGIFPAIPADVVSYRALAREMNRYGQAAADRGLRFYYHNHDWEFARAGGEVLYDVLLDDTDPDLVFFELDLYWIVTAGATRSTTCTATTSPAGPSSTSRTARRARAPRRPRSPTSARASSASSGSSGSWTTSTTTTSSSSATPSRTPRGRLGSATSTSAA